MTTSIPEKLKQTLVGLDGKGYKAYKKLQGTAWSYPPFLMKFEHVQGDSFAFPSRLSITLAMADAGFPEKFSIPQPEGSRLRIFFCAVFIRAVPGRNFAPGVRAKAASSPRWSRDKKFLNVTPS